ncbi:hypothetical protein M407DRAFT_81291 [Tulasnella calospora MUT 4182]|uniref:HTH CENPB-type domain-containing protein n=1 Tax=Tulasnella calospora MUT 4182 TaxID=1051891 RepID=A0A0C3Q8M2_9AGAM|nr:hypothetical protein M407DRAFT_81291 [Tulasnella calospora MUT 4182]
MPKARTITSEKRKANAVKEAAKIAARKAVLDQWNKPVDERRSIGQIAKEFGVDHSVLSRLAKGQPTMGEFNAGKQLLTPAEEHTIVDFLIGMGKRSFPLTHRMIMEKSYHILSAKFGPTVEIGQLWVTRFLHRHSRLSIYHATPLEQNRAIGMNPEAYKDYVETVDELFTLHNPPQSNILGMDEVGINSGIFSRQLVVGEAGQRHQHLQKNGERKNTTCIETIMGDGTVLRPMVIFKGKYRMSSWSEVNPNNANVTVSSRGYITNEIGVEYIRDFHRQTAHLCHDLGPRFLFVDGHSSHCTLEFLEFAVAHNIIVISYPPHTTHWLQGLDVACFGPLKIYWSQECDKFWRATGKRVNNDTFLLVYSRARAQAFTVDTIKSAWRLIPFRKDFFHAESDALAPA